MLKNFGYDGTYKDENLSIGLLLENPSEYGLAETNLVFSVMFSERNTSVSRTKFEDFNFYIMDEANHLYRTRSVPAPRMRIEAADDEPIRQPDGLILADFNPGLLFQDLRIAFYYQPYRRILIIECKH